MFIIRHYPKNQTETLDHNRYHPFYNENQCVKWRFLDYYGLNKFIRMYFFIFSILVYASEDTSPGMNLPIGWGIRNPSFFWFLSKIFWK